MFTDPLLAAEFERRAIRRSIPVGHVLLRPGDPITHVPIVEQGRLRILAQDAEGHERFLYHIMPGETCAMSLTCCTSRRTSGVMAIVEEGAVLAMLPAEVLEEWMDHPEWRRFVSDSQAQRFQELLDTVEHVAFDKLDEQLWHYLAKRAQACGGYALKLTHQEIAQELGSPREVITRLLNQLQQRGWVTLSRGSVEVHLLRGT